MKKESSKKPLIGTDGEVREISRKDFADFMPASDVLSPSLQEKVGLRHRGPQKRPTKQRISIRLSPEVVNSFKSGGPGWQTRIDDALKDWLRGH